MPPLNRYEIGLLTAEHIRRWLDANGYINSDHLIGEQSMTDFTAAPPTAAELATLVRQESLSLNLPAHGVAIIGCGGVGSWVAILLACSGVRNLWLFDPDNVSDHNLNRLPVPPTTIGTSKSKALAATLAILRPGIRTVALGSFTPDLATTMRLHREVDWVVCTTDTHISRREAVNWCRDTGTQYIEAAAEGEYGSISDAPAEFATEDERRPGYASVPVWVGPCCVAAMMAVAYVVHNTQPLIDTAVRVGWNGEITFFSFLQQRQRPTLYRIEHRVSPDARWRRSGDFFNMYTLEEANNLIAPRNQMSPDQPRYRATPVESEAPPPPMAPDSVYPWDFRPNQPPPIQNMPHNVAETLAALDARMAATLDRPAVTIPVGTPQWVRVEPHPPEPTITNDDGDYDDTVAHPGDEGDDEEDAA